MNKKGFISILAILTLLSILLISIGFVGLYSALNKNDDVTTVGFKIYVENQEGETTEIATLLPQETDPLTLLVTAISGFPSPPPVPEVPIPPVGESTSPSTTETTKPEPSTTTTPSDTTATDTTTTTNPETSPPVTTTEQTGSIEITNAYRIVMIPVVRWRISPPTVTPNITITEYAGFLTVYHNQNIASPKIKDRKIFMSLNYSVGTVRDGQVTVLKQIGGKSFALVERIKGVGGILSEPDGLYEYRPMISIKFKAEYNGTVTEGAIRGVGYITIEKLQDRVFIKGNIQLTSLALVKPLQSGVNFTIFDLSVLQSIRIAILMIVLGTIVLILVWVQGLRKKILNLLTH